MDFNPLRFISEPIQVEFEHPPAIEKSPHCPDAFTWDETRHDIQQLLRQWQDFERRGAMRHNMRPSSMRKAARRGSYGVGRFYFLVQTTEQRYFELYYDRTVHSTDDRKGQWVLFKEVTPAAPD